MQRCCLIHSTLSLPAFLFLLRNFGSKFNSIFVSWIKCPYVFPFQVNFDSISEIAPKSVRSLLLLLLLGMEITEIPMVPINFPTKLYHAFEQIKSESQQIEWTNKPNLSHSKRSIFLLAETEDAIFIATMYSCVFQRFLFSLLSMERHHFSRLFIVETFFFVQTLRSTILLLCAVHNRFVIFLLQFFLFLSKCTSLSLSFTPILARQSLIRGVFLYILRLNAIAPFLKHLFKLLSMLLLFVPFITLMGGIDK